MRIDLENWQDLFDDKAIQRLAETAYAEARGEGEAGMHAVLSAIGNRLKLSMAGKGYNWGDTPLEIATYGKDGRKQFSPWNSTDPNNPINNPPDRNNPLYKTAHALAEKLAAGELPDITGGAEHFHATSIDAPGWTTGQTATTIGNHKFYSLLSADSRISLVEPDVMSPDRRIRFAFDDAATIPGVDMMHTASLSPAEMDLWSNPSTLGPAMATGSMDFDNTFNHYQSAHGYIGHMDMTPDPVDTREFTAIPDAVLKAASADIAARVDDNAPIIFKADADGATDETFKVKGSLSQTILEAAKHYGIEDMTGGKAWLLSKEIAAMNDIQNENRVRAGTEISIPRSVFTPSM